MPTNDSNMEDLQSLNLIRQGGKMRDQGVDALWRKYADPENKTSILWKLIRMSNYKLREEDADEIMQETFIKVVRHCESYRGDSPLAAWIWGIAYNYMIDLIRKDETRSTTDADKAANKIKKEAIASERTAAMEAGESRVQGGVKVTELPYAGESEAKAHRISSPPMFISIDNDGDGDENAGLMALEGQFHSLWKYDQPPDKASFEDCIERGFAEFASKSEGNSKRAHALRLVADGQDQVSIANVINRDPAKIRKYLYECRKMIKEFILPCQEFQ